VEILWQFQAAGYLKVLYRNDFVSKPPDTELVVNSSSYEKLKKIVKRLFVEPFKTALFTATTKTKVLVFVCSKVLEGNGYEARQTSKPGANKDAKISVGRSKTAMHNLLFCVHTLCMNYVTKTFLLVSSSVQSKQLLCFMHGQGQKSEQKPKTKIFVRIHNQFPLLTMVRSICFCYGLLWFFCHCFVDGNNFPRYTIKRYMAFPKQNTWILLSFDLNSILARQTSEKVAYKPGLDNPVLEWFLPNTFVRIISVLPENFKKFLKLEGCSPPSALPGSFAYD